MICQQIFSILARVIFLKTLFKQCFKIIFFPQLCVGFLFLILYPGSAPPPPASRLHTLTHTLTYTQHTNLTYNNFTHTHTHTTLSHTISHTITSHKLPTHSHTQLCHIPSLTYYNFLTYNNFTHTHTHNFVTYHLPSLTY